MQLANQTFYFANFIVLVGLMARFLANRDDDRAQFRVIYWPVGLSFLATSMLGYAIAPWGGKIILALANLFLVLGVASISMLFSFWNHSLKQSNKLFAGIITLGACIAYIFLLFVGVTQDRIHLMNFVALMVFSPHQNPD